MTDNNEKNNLNLSSNSNVKIKTEDKGLIKDEMNKKNKSDLNESTSKILSD